MCVFFFFFFFFFFFQEGSGACQHPDQPFCINVLRVRDPCSRSQFTQSVSKCFLIHLIDNASCYVGSLLDFTVVQHEQVSYDGSAAVKLTVTYR